MFRSCLVFGVLLCALAGCESLQEKNLDLIKDRSNKLKPLQTWSPTWCRVETHLTQPALARYHEMFPEEIDKIGEESWAYTWKAQKTGCEVTSLEPSPMTKNHQLFLEGALCTLVQVHWVNSPFAELKFNTSDVGNDGDQVQIRIASEQGLGLFLDPQTFTIQTRTKSRGVLTAVYAQRGDDWVPVSLQQTKGNSTIRLDAIEYSDERLNGRPTLKTFWISIGEGTPLQHTQVNLSECKNY